MKYRLIRFDQKGEVVLDKPCITPNQYGDNYAWRDEGGEAVLIETSRKVTKTPEGFSTDEKHKKFYTFYAINSEYPESLWVLTSLQEMAQRYKYLQMLQLTDSI